MTAHRTPLEIDHEFPVDRFDETLPDSLQNEGVRWLRPSQIVTNPKFFSEEHLEDPYKRRNDVIKGQNGGFFLAPVAALTAYEDMFDVVVVPGQGFGEGYNGTFRFQFYTKENSEPRVVQIDDQLPTVNCQLVFAKAPRDVFWGPLLEKAYAKYIGGYNQLNLGMMCTVLTHLTGQKALTLYTRTLLPSALYARLSELMSKEQMLCCKHKHYDNNNMEYGGSFTITGLRGSQSNPCHNQIRVRNVTDDEEEWVQLDEFQKNYDVVFSTVETERMERRMMIGAPNLMGHSGRGFDWNGRSIALSTHAGWFWQVLEHLERAFGDGDGRFGVRGFR